jgi:phosphatidate cytidylyltransferase
MGTGNLMLRVASAAVLAPVTLAITYAGGWIFLGLCTIAAAGILWEWASLVSHRADPRILAPGWAALVAAMVLTGAHLPDGAWAAIGIGAVVAGLVWRCGRAARRKPLPRSEFHRCGAPEG